MEEKVKAEEKEQENSNLAVIRVRGLTGIKKDISKTLDQLRLYRRNYCIILPNKKSNLGMVTKVKDYVTWGGIDDDTLNLLVEKKGQDYKGREQDSKNKIKYNRFLKIKDRNIKKFFRLNSPKKGYGRKGIKVTFSQGGALGYRSDKIKDLIKRML
jgi:large subunit ribosomal protein L30|tara:strand:+ start:301 stop:768 length:468 start_codon:yes stop_codon:yes gene_type:complete